MQVDLYDQKIDLGQSPSKVCSQRWTGQMSPEPETVAWIESLPRGDVFFDIGANVGTFSVRAHLRGLTVYAFEPQNDNWLELRNLIQRNNLTIELSKLVLYNEAVYGELGRGRSWDTFIAGKGDIMSTTVDTFTRVRRVQPDHIKLDVDGNEYDILLGAKDTLPGVKSILVEIDPMIEDHALIPTYLADFGFKYDKAQVELCRVRGGKFDGMANWIFWRA